VTDTYIPITKDIRLEINGNVDDIAKYPHLGRLLDIHTRCVLARVKFNGYAPQLDHKISLYCYDLLDRMGLAQWSTAVRDEPYAHMWHVIWLGDDTANMIERLARHAVETSLTSSMSEDPTLITIQGSLVGISQHDLIRFEAIET
jgi:hypothetical protein